MKGSASTADLASDLKILSAQVAALQEVQYATFDMTIRRYKLLQKVTFGLFDSERKLLKDMLQGGCVLVGTFHFKTMSRYTFRKRI